MRKVLISTTLAVFTCFAIIGVAQDSSKPAASKATATDKKADSTAKKGRLPANYGKLGLTDPQKDKIYGIQSSYSDQLDALEAQIAAVRSKRDQEVESVLTEDQRKVLKNLNEAAKDKGKKDDSSSDSEKMDK